MFTEDLIMPLGRVFVAFRVRSHARVTTPRRAANGRLSAHPVGRLPGRLPYGAGAGSVAFPGRLDLLEAGVRRLVGIDVGWRRDVDRRRANGLWQLFLRRCHKADIDGDAVLIGS
jgi:hypothetical protein